MTTKMVGQKTKRKKRWPDEETLEFGRRLEWARKRAGHKRAASAIQQIKKYMKLDVRSYYLYEEGQRAPEDDGLIEFFAWLFEVPLNYLLLEQTEPESSAAIRPIFAPINQHVDNASKIVDVRYIFILTASDIKKLAVGTGKLQTMSGEKLPMPRHVAAGPRTFCYKIPPLDNSMVGPAGRSFPPGDYLIIDPDREIAPGDYLLGLPAGFQAPVLRRLQASHSYLAKIPRYPFKLIALNPLTEPIQVNRAEDCAILGRMIFIMQAW